MKPPAHAQKNSAAKRKAPSGVELQTAIDVLARRNPDEILTTEEAEEITGFTQQSFYNWIKRSVNPLKASKPGREWRIRVGDLIEFLARREFRAEDGEDGGAEGGGERRGGSNLRLLRLAPAASHPSAEPEGGGRDAEAASPAGPAEVIETLLVIAGAGLKWRRAHLTMQTADASEEAEWIAECESETLRRQEELFAACALLDPKSLLSLRRALDEARSGGGALAGVAVAEPEADRVAPELLERAAQAANALPRGAAERHRAVVLDRPQPGAFRVGLVEDWNVDARRAVARALGTTTQLVAFERLTEGQFARLLAHAYGDAGAARREGLNAVAS